jgi:tetratricopeptide (TPR) repeat protein
MGDDDWYRNLCWDAETEAAFEARLARSRSQKAQYLRIQGSLLKQSHPEVAVRLLERCAEQADPFHVAHAHAEAAHARYLLGDIDGALHSFEAAMDQQAAEPMFRTSAAFDYALVVALHECADRYDRALAALARDVEPFFSSMQFEASGARALIFAARGQWQEARIAARRALQAAGDRIGWIPGRPDVGIVPDEDNPLSRRLRAIVQESH